MKNLGGKYPLKASFLIKKRNVETGRYAINNISKKAKTVLADRLFEFA